MFCIGAQCSGGHEDSGLFQAASDHADQDYWRAVNEQAEDDAPEALPEKPEGRTVIPPFLLLLALADPGLGPRFDQLPLLGLTLGLRLVPLHLLTLPFHRPL